VGKIFSARPDRPWDPSRLLYNRYQVSLEGKVWPERDAEPSPFLASTSGKRRAIPLSPWATTGPVTGLLYLSTIIIIIIIIIIFYRYFSAKGLLFCSCTISS
jgi:hypothetical protein